MKVRFFLSIHLGRHQLQNPAEASSKSQMSAGSATTKVLAETSKPFELFPQVFVAEAVFMRELTAVLTTDANEQMYFLTGPKLGPIRTISRWARHAALEKQSPVFVRASARSVASVLIPIIEQGAELHVIAHSHPGSGAGATTPSSTDIECLGKLQRAGSQAIGCIVTRDHFIRFFSVERNFHVLVLGTGVIEVSKNVFRITTEDSH